MLFFASLPMGIEDIRASVQNILACKYIANMGIKVVSEFKKRSCMYKFIAPVGIDNASVSVQGNKIINCHKTGLATLALNRFQALTLHPWE